MDRLTQKPTKKQRSPAVPIAGGERSDPPALGGQNAPLGTITKSHSRFIKFKDLAWNGQNPPNLPLVIKNDLTGPFLATQRSKLGTSTAAKRGTEVRPPNGGEFVRTWPGMEEGVARPCSIFQVQNLALAPRGERIDPVTGEILTGEQSVDAALAGRLNRFLLQSAARSILPKANRTRICLRNRRETENGVEVWRSLEHKATHFGNLMVCGSVWVCPVCAAKISERRREELKQAIYAHGKGMGDVVLITLTIPHSRYDDLADLLRRLSHAMKLFKGGKLAQRIRQFVGLQGSIRALEVTHGENGWHPHFHEIWFIEVGHNCEWLRAELLTQWQRACLKAGLSCPSETHGVDVRPGHEAAWYVGKFGSDQDTKWNMTHELTKANQKKGRFGRSTPFDLLRRVAFDADKQACALFNEYAVCFRGQRQLVWSRGLKTLFGIGETTDDDIATEVREESELLGSLTLHQWRRVLDSESRGVILELARLSWSDVLSYVLTLPSCLSES